MIEEKTDKRSLRQTILLVDFSENMKDTDFAPSRITCTLNYVLKMIDKFVENNPLSEMSILLLRDLKSICLKNFKENFFKAKTVIKKMVKENTDNEDFNLHATLKMTTIKENEPKGQISILNGLTMAKDLFSNSPLYYHKEVYLITSSVNSIDSDDFFNIIDWYKSQKIRISIISLSCNNFLYKKIIESCNGKIVFPSKKDDFEDYIFVY